MIQLPGPLRLAPTFPFVGRAAELATLRTLLPSSGSAGSKVVLLAGEAGSGKSRLVRELAHEAVELGVTTLYGSCDMAVRAPYEPFLEALGQLVAQSDPELLREDLGATGAELARLLPDLPTPPAPPGPSTTDPDGERYRLHVAASHLLAGAARRAPLLLVLEDLHWGDASTLHLLRHVVRTGGGEDILLIATFREGGSDSRGDLPATLADLARADGVVRLRLGGLSAEEVGELVGRVAGEQHSREAESIAETISESTGGNPFLVGELSRALAESGAFAAGSLGSLASSEGVRNIVEQRLGRLAASTRRLLELAAALGPRFELRVLGTAATLDEGGLRAGLDEAVQSGMIHEVPPLGLSYRFAHELVRRALLDALTGVRRAELHLRVGEALEQVHGDESSVLADLAYHFALASPLTEPERASRYNVAAARAAASLVAHEEAARLYRTALEIGIADGHLRAEVQVELGESLQCAGEPLAALECLRAAAAAARALDDPVLLAQAAIAVEEASWGPAITDGQTLALIREALGALGGDERALRIRLLAALARALVLRGHREQAAQTCTQALQLARKTGDRRAMAAALIQRYWAPGNATPAEVLAMLDEAERLAEELSDSGTRGAAITAQMATLARLGQLAGARTQLEVLRNLAGEAGMPLLHHAAETFGSSLALCEGRLEDAEAMAERGAEWGRLLRGTDTSGSYGVQLFNLRREQGRLGELAPVGDGLVNAAGRDAVWAPGLVVLLCELGRHDDARRELSRICERGLPSIGRESLRAGALAYLADAAVTLGESEACALVYDELAPCEGRPLLIGYLVACFGAADRYLGKLAGALGRWGPAERHFESALELNRQMGMPLWLAHTQYEYGLMLLARGTRQEAGRATELLASAAGSAATMGTQGLAVKVAAAQRPAPGPASTPDQLSPREVAVLRLVARGLSNRDIGDALVISEHTAANHVRSILRKTGCGNRTEATAYAYDHDLAAS